MEPSLPYSKARTLAEAILDFIDYYGYCDSTTDAITDVLTGDPTVDEFIEEVKELNQQRRNEKP